jgi:hypothetical protein
MNYCGDNCGFLGLFPSDKCKADAECSCKSCATFKSIDLNLYEGCVAACNAETNRPKTREDYLKRFKAQELFDRYKIQVDGFDPTDTPEGKALKEAQGRTDTQQGFLGKILLFGLVIVGAVVAYFFISD